MSDTDKKVQKLFDIVQTKKAEVKSAESKAKWITNCVFKYHTDRADTTLNIQTVKNIDDIVHALAILYEREEYFNKAAKALNVKTKFTWSGHQVIDWQTDFQTRISKITINDKKKELISLEKRLDALVSPELKARLELEAIEAALVE